MVWLQYQKEFLGYDWSNRKGAEGIVINKAGGKLYNHADRFAPNTLASYVRAMFDRQNHQITAELSEYAYHVNTADMLDFSLTTFNKAIRTSVQKKVEIVSKYPLKPLNTLLLKINGFTTKIEKNEILDNGNYPVITQEAGKLISGYTNNVQTINDLPLIVFGDHSCTFKYIDFEFIRGADGTQLLKTDENILKSKFLYHYLLTVEIENSTKYERHFKYLKNMKIPLPPPDIQQQIIDECQKIDDEYETSRMSIETYRQKIADIFDELEVVKNSPTGGVNLVKIKELCYLRGELIDPNNQNGEVFYVGLENIESNTRNLIGNCISNYQEIQSTKNVFYKDDVLFGKLRPNLNKVHLCQNNGICSTDILVLVPKISGKLLSYYLSSKPFNEKVLTTVSGQQLPRTSWGKISNLQINLPNDETQQSIITQIEHYESLIATAEAIMAGSADKKKAVLERYL